MLRKLNCFLNIVIGSFSGRMYCPKVGYLEKIKAITSSLTE